MKNPYEQGTPEWLIYENIISYERQAISWAEDAQRYQAKSQAARETADKYRAALEKLK